MENRRLAQLKQVAEPQQQVQPGTRGLATQPEDSGAGLITATGQPQELPSCQDLQPQAEDSGLTAITSGVSAPVSAQQKIKDVTPEDVKKHVYDREMEHSKQESDAYEKDLLLGNITPKTYEGLFADKSTLGKIGTIFGLMVSGFGSRLSGQKNMLLEMMNNEIERDIKAQEKSPENAQNFYKLNHDAILQKAQAEGLKVDAKLKAHALSSFSTTTPPARRRCIPACC